ncbi:hypothetical protein ACF1D2_06915 [Streptomyces bacillaris]|uniref:hypothetical protein n=1 Tax=Streptomyces TaxID=1883 RepID=UPI000CD3DD1E|nr:hypothetical protein [Streptomyces sp. ZL-24]POG49058.1 hypothetical protein BV881_02680 [Streptomyces sp. ZL-24]
MTAGAGAGRDRKVDEVRRMLEGPHPPVPVDLAGRAVRRGARLLRLRRGARRTGWWLAGTVFAAFLVWAGVEQPWLPEPAEVTPPLEGW